MILKKQYLTFVFDTYTQKLKQRVKNACKLATLTFAKKSIFQKKFFIEM